MRRGWRIGAGIVKLLSSVNITGNSWIREEAELEFLKSLWGLGTEEE
jgi:hypothetical protein